MCIRDSSITLTDANGCSSAIINGGNNQVVVPFALSTTASIDFSSVVNVLCNSSATGSVSALNPITNNTNYSYSWENVNNPGVTVSGTTTLFYHQNSDGEINQIDLVANNAYGIGTALNGTQVSAGVATLVAPEYQGRVVTGATDGSSDLGEFNGEVIFHENRKAFARSSTQTEEVKLIIQL